MYLKKEFLQLPFTKKKNYSILYSDYEDIKVGAIKLCYNLKKGNFLIQVFTHDKLNDILSLYKNNYFNYKNFNYYLINNLDFLNDLSFEKIRFLNIYSINNKDVTTYMQLKEALTDYTFKLGLDNYLDFAEVIINFEYYDKQVIDIFNKTN